MLSKCPDELSENDELKGNELSGSDCIYRLTGFMSNHMAGVGTEGIGIGGAYYHSTHEGPEFPGVPYDYVITYEFLCVPLLVKSFPIICGVKLNAPICLKYFLNSHNNISTFKT